MPSVIRIVSIPLPLFDFQALSRSMEAFIEIPIVHNVDIVAENSASIQVSDFMESDYCNLKSDSGDVSAMKVKTKNLNIETESGDIFCHGHIQVSVSFNNTVTSSVIFLANITSSSSIWLEKRQKISVNFLI